MKIITFDEIKQLNIDPVTCYKWVDEMIKNKNSTQLPPKISMHYGEKSFCNVMPCIISDKIGGVKIINRVPERTPSLESKLLLINPETGEFEALMDANWITAMRTGAVAVHSIDLLAKKDFSTIAIIGLGNTARATMLVFANLYTNKSFTVKLLRYKDQEVSFSERFKEYSNLHFEYYDSINELITGSDVVISCATYFDKDICLDSAFDKGVLVIPVHTRGFTNCDLFFEKVYADDIGHVSHFKNFDKFKYFAEISDVINNNARGRTNNDERIIVYNIGISVHDIYFAYNIFRLICNDDNLKCIDFHNPQNKFWV